MLCSAERFYEHLFLLKFNEKNILIIIISYINLELKKKNKTKERMKQIKGCQYSKWTTQKINKITKIIKMVYVFRKYVDIYFCKWKCN